MRSDFTVAGSVIGRMPRYTIEEFQDKRVIYDNSAKKIVHVEFFFGRDFEVLCDKLNAAKKEIDQCK